MKSHPQRSMLWLMRYILPVKWRMAGLLALLLLTTAMQLANPQMVQHFIDTAAGGGPVSRLLGIAGAYLAIAVCTQLTSVAVSYLGNDVAWRATNQLRADLLRHCLGLDMRFHNLRTPGEMMERIDGDVTHMSNFFAMFIVQMFGSAVLLAGILGIMFARNVPIAAIMTAFTLLALAAMVRIRDVGVAASQAERQANAALFGLIEERIAGIEDVQTSGAVSHVMNRFHRAMRHVFQTGRRAWMMRVIPWNVTVVLYAMAVTGVLMMGVHLYLTGGATLGTLYLFYQYTQMLNDPIEQLSNQLQDYQRAKSGMRRSLELLSMRSGIEEGERTDLPEGPLGVAFEHVHFSYQPGEPVLHDIHFELRPGERLGIVGRTGSGKSSISRLLLRLYNLDSGVIRLGGVDIRELRLDTLYGRVGMVTQDVQLFDGTLRDNLTLFNPGVPEAEILAVVDRLGLRPLLERLPEGLDTRLGAGGSSLSAGEAQLVALTRVFLTKPSLVILDEPSSRLDPATEATLQAAIDHLLEHCTGIVIAHRLSTLAKVDKILVLGQGRMLEFGDRAALADDPASHFAALLRKDRLEVWA